MNIQIKELKGKWSIPHTLLLLSNPSKEIIKDNTQRGTCYIATHNNETIGVYVLTKTSDDTMEIINIAVDEKYQGKGIGKKLVLDAIEKAGNFGMKKLEVATTNSNLNQLALYQKCGFRISDVIKDFFLNDKKIENGIPCVDMIRLSKDL